MHRGARSLHLDICDYDKNAVCNLYDNQTMLPGQATDVFVHSTRQNGWKELTFKIPSTCFDGEEEVENFRLKYLIADYTIRLQTDNKEDYYIISEPRIIHNGNKYVEVTAGHISQLLKTKNLNLEFSDQEGNNFGTAEQILTTILEGTSWSVGTVYPFVEDDGQTPKVRSLVASAKTGAFMLVANLCEKFDAAPIYHGDTRTVDLVPLNPFSRLTDAYNPSEVLGNTQALELRYGTNVSDVTRTLNTENLVTRLYAYGSWGDKTYGMCSLQEVQHTEYKMTVPSEGTEFYFVDKYGDNKYFTLKQGWAEGDSLVYSDLDPSSRSYIWNENKENCAPVYGQRTTQNPVLLTPEEEDVTNWVQYLMDFTYYDKIGLLTQEMKDTIAGFQRTIPTLSEDAYNASLNLSEAKGELSLLADSLVGYLRLDVASYNVGENNELVLNIRKTTEHPDGVLYRSDYLEARKNYFSWYCAKELKDNGDIKSGPGSVVYIIHDTTPVTWEKAYIKLIDGEQETQDYSTMSTDPNNITLWIKATDVAAIRESDRFFLFAADSMQGRLGATEISVETILSTLEQTTKVITQTHPTYFVWDSDPAPDTSPLENSYGWYYRTYSNTEDMGELYFFWGTAGEGNWHKVYLEEFPPTPVNAAYFYNLRTRQLFHGESDGQGTKWVNIAEMDVHVINHEQLDVTYTAPDTEAKALSQSFSKVAMYCMKYDETYKGLYPEYVYTPQNTLPKGNYAIKCPFGYYWVFTTDKDIPTTGSLRFVVKDQHVHQSDEPQDIVSSEVKQYEVLDFPNENIFNGVNFKPGSLNLNNGTEINSDTASRSYYVSVYSDTQYEYNLPEAEQPVVDPGETPEIVSPISWGCFYDANKNFLETRSLDGTGTFTTHVRAKYMRLVTENFGSSNYVRVKDYQSNFFIKGVQYTILPATGQGEKGGVNNLMKLFADLSDKCYYKYYEDDEWKDGYLIVLNESQETINNKEIRLKDTLKDLYREGYWQKNDYVDGDEDKLYQDSLDNLMRISHPEATYEVTFLDLYASNKDIGYSVTEDLDKVDWPDIEVTDAVHLIDEDIDENCWAYIDTLDKCYDQPWRTTMAINTDLSLIGQRSFTDAIQRIAQVSNETSIKQTLYERAANISGSGTMAADKLSGTINTNRTMMSGGASNWYTDPNGNIVFESADGQSALMLTGYGWCAANTKDKYGDWEFRTFGTGNGLVGDEIIGGTIYGSQIVAGTIEADALHASVGQTLEIGSNDALLLYATVDGFRPAGALETQVSEGDGTFHPVEEGDSYIKISSQEGQEKAEIAIVSGGQLNLQGGTMNMTAQSNMNLTGGNINLKTGGMIHMEANSKIELLTNSMIDVSAGSINITNDGDMVVGNSGSVSVTSGGKIDVSSLGEMDISSGGHLNIESQGNIHIVSGGTFTVDSDKFEIDSDGNVTMEGEITATGGNIGGWIIDDGILYSGTTTGQNPTYVALSSDANETYAIWAGAETGSNAKFSVTKTGNMTAKSGKIANWDIGEYQLSSGYTTTTVALNSNPGTDYAIWAGATNAETTTNNTTTYAPFFVKRDGYVRATTGNIGGWTMTATRLSSGEDGTDQQGNFTSSYVALDSGTGDYAIWAGNETASSAPFTVKRNGDMKSTSGHIGNWHISASRLASGSGTSYVALDSSSDGTYAIWAGSNTASSAPFSVTRTGALTSTSGEIGGWSIDPVIDNAQTSRLASGTGNNTVVLDSGTTGMTYAIWVGRATPETTVNGTTTYAPFSVTRNGMLRATGADISGSLKAGAGSVIGGWNVDANRLSSGTSTNTVALDSGTSGMNYAIWAGATSPTWQETEDGVVVTKYAPFSVQRDGTVIVTKLYGLSSNGKTLYNVNIGASLWKLRWHTIQSVDTEDNVLTITYDDGTTKTFRKAGEVDHLSGSVGVPSQSGDNWSATGTGTAVFVGGGTQEDVPITVDVSLAYGTGIIAGRELATINGAVTFNPPVVELLSSDTGESTHTVSMTYKTYITDASEKTKQNVSIKVNASNVYTAGVTAGANRVTIGIASLDNIVLETGQKSGQRSTTLSYQITGASDSHTYGPMQIGVNATEIYNDGWKAANAKVVTPTSGGSSTSFVVKYPAATVDTQNQTTYTMSLDATPATTGYAYVTTGAGTVAQINIGGWYSAGRTAGANTVTIGRGSLTDIVLASGEKTGQRSTTLGYQISGASDSHSYGPMQIGVDATAIYTDGQNSVNVSKGSWSGGNITFSTSAGSGTGSNVKLTLSKSTLAGVTTVTALDDGANTHCSTTVDNSSDYQSGWVAGYNRAVSKVSRSTNTITVPARTSAYNTDPTDSYVATPKVDDSHYVIKGSATNLTPGQVFTGSAGSYYYGPNIALGGSASPYVQWNK